ncbi:MAG TPA: hypothetical protein VE130_06450 [Nitrososphaeraceae archaeon]|nr:hypothetical protein [Nitrososphaeraceae archaeon]
MHKNKTVIFVAVVNNRGKLLFGQSSTRNCVTCKRGEVIRSSSSQDASYFCVGTKSEAYQFFNNCLVPLINLSANDDTCAASKAQKMVIPLYDMISPVNIFVKV